MAKNSAATSGHLKELELLPLLRDAVSIAIPEPVWYAEPSALFPFGVVGYTKIQGQPLTPTRLRPTNVKQIAADIALVMARWCSAKLAAQNNMKMRITHSA